MSQANVNVGTSPGAGNGDSLYNAFSKINNNFTELYSTITSSGITYANIAPSVDSSASGSGLTLNITKYANIYGVSVNLAGTGYALGESVRVWGNVVGGSYTTHDLIVEVGTLANSSIGSVGTITFTGTPSVPLRTVAGRTGDVVLTTNDIIGLRSTFSSNADIQSVVDAKISANISSLIGTAPGVLDTLGEIADALNDDANVYNTLATSITTGNTNLKGYTDNLVTTANVNMKGYVDAEITAIGAHYGNADVLAYLNDNSYATETYVTTANTNVVGYVDGQVTTLNSAITTANTNVVGYVDDAVSTANVNLKGYTDDQFTTGNTNVVGYVDSAITTANVNLKGYVDSEISDTVSATGSSIAEANTNMRGYVDGQVTTLNSSITTANTNVVGYVDSAVSTANVNLKGYVDNELTSYATTSALTTANTNVVGYVDSAVSTANVNVVGYIDNEISTLIGGAPGTLDTLNEIAAALGDDPNLATTLTNTITSANLNMKGYVDGQVTTLNSTITTANTNVVGYVDNAVSTANVNLKGYVDNELTSYATTSALTTANTNVVGYVDGEITTVNSAITTANTNVVGYVDDAVSTANVNLKGYVDNEISGLSLGNISTINLDGNVSNVLAGDGTFITAGSGGTSYTDSDVDAHLNQSNPTSGYVLSWNGSDYAWVDNAGYADSDVNTLLASWGSNTLSTTGNVTVGDAIVNSGVKEAYGALSSATGTVTHDCSNGHVFYHTSISSDFTANFTNLQLDTGYVTTLTLVLSQGATAYIASAVQIEGVAQTIKWQGNVTPTGTDNGVDAMSFSVINSSGTYTVLGQLVDFGG